MIRERANVGLQPNSNPKNGLCNKQTKMQKGLPWSQPTTRVLIVQAKHHENTYLDTRKGRG